ncbi:hypothetical protein AKO1_005555 [Acrasis kona]|uniref:Peptidase M28 domain-containing protein n=1 Tax=Acrasis kona TaxID=1008807 RepID=A0AAW2YKT4_9EUKA
MIESIRNIASRKTTIDSMIRPIIFLFNGAEETMLSGAHAFTKNHPWSSHIRVFLNLEAAGTGGRPIVFQSTNAWVMSQYAFANQNALGTVAAQDVFQSNAVPSDTDYRYFVNAGMIGLDVAFYRNGHTYHTKRESFDLVDHSSIKNMGDDTLRFMERLSSITDEFPSRNEVDKSNVAVYYDLMSYYMVVMDAKSACAINIAVVFVTLFSLLRSFTFELVMSLVMLFCCLVCGIVSSVVNAVVLTKLFGCKMVFYSMHPYYALLLYGAPSLVGNLCSIRFFTKWFALDYKSVHRAITLTCLLILMVGTYFKIGTSFLPMLLCVTLSVTSFIESDHFVKRVLIVLLNVPCLLFIVFLSFSMLDLFVPVMGRFGDKPTDIIISVLTAILTNWIIVLIKPLLFEKNTKRTTWIVLSCFVVLSISTTIYSGLFVHPYSKFRPKRVSVQHVNHMVVNHFDHSKLQVDFKKSCHLTQSYIGVGSLDNIHEDFLNNHLEDFKYRNETELFYLPSFSRPVKRRNGFYTKLVNGNIEASNKITPHITVDYDQSSNRLFVGIDQSNTVKLLSTHVHVYSKNKFEQSSFEIIPLNQAKSSSALYSYSWIHFQGAQHDENDLKKKVWVSAYRHDNSTFGGISAIRVVSTCAEHQYFSSALNQTLRNVEWIAEARVMVSVADILLVEPCNLGE